MDGGEDLGFNMRSPAWFDVTLSHRGRWLQAFLTKRTLIVCNEFFATFFTLREQVALSSIIDMTVHTVDLTGMVRNWARRRDLYRKLRSCFRQTI